MPFSMNRRTFIATTSAFAVGAACEGTVFAQTANPYMGPFTEKATAEEVTKGIDLKGTNRAYHGREFRPGL